MTSRKTLPVPQHSTPSFDGIWSFSACHAIHVASASCVQAVAISVSSHDTVMHACACMTRKVGSIYHSSLKQTRHDTILFCVHHAGVWHRLYWQDGNIPAHKQRPSRASKTAGSNFDKPAAIFDRKSKDGQHMLRSDAVQCLLIVVCTAEGGVETDSRYGSSPATTSYACCNCLFMSSTLSDCRALPSRAVMTSTGVSGWPVA